MEKFAFYDFDDTLLKHDSMGHLFFYYVKRHPLSIFRGFYLILLFVLYLLKMISFQKVKETLIFPLSKMSDEELAQFYHDDLIPRYYPNVLETLKRHAKEGYHVWLVSASPEAYLTYTDLPVERIIGTKIARKDGRWTHKIISKNCKGIEKVERINEELKKMNLQIDYENSYGYSDSDSDWPMLCLVKNRFRINKKTAEISEFVKTDQ